MAIDDLLDEHEQSERVRNWLKNNGAGLIGGIALGLAVIFGWQWWQKRQVQQAEQANVSYQSALDSIGTADLKKAQAEVGKLEDGNAYANLAALRLAKAQVDAGQAEAAIATLRGIKADQTLQSLVDLRLSRLLTDAGKGEEALKILGDAADSASLEARGDALLATGKRDQARDTYLKALTGMDVAAPQRRLVELKLSDLGGTPPKPAQPTS
ncbi:YfgM family protein [Pseudoxanthomonas sacheonensis]|uniref:Ancillary SecYEG translocon subunit n=1 Tax=Pseudoxanthomonas sacheonensis TaxID=443615 RepID=A0ABU1RPF1_9GAMM|nr:tetratricopeptide repeat protein [Pseudoxanthomonas sacheonensis]MDR6840651.1 putative negative regulator of RcsB-dependent stress response [Pseudoxanthomonas sacheonensis]